MIKTLINKKAVREFLLSQTKAMRPGWNCERVSSKVLEDIDAFLRFRLTRMVHQHPTLGKTFTESQL